MKSNHRVVRGETKLARKLPDGNAVDNHSAKDGGVLWLQPLGLRQDAPTIDAAGLRVRYLCGIDGYRDLAPLPELVDEHRPDDAGHPSLGTA